MAKPLYDTLLVNLRLADGGAPGRALALKSGQIAAILPADRFGKKRLLISDMDSTMIGQECIDELADYAGLKPQIAAITERAMQGELDFG